MAEEVDAVLGVVLVDFVVRASNGLAVDDGGELISRGSRGGVGESSQDGRESSDGEMHFVLFFCLLAWQVFTCPMRNIPKLRIKYRKCTIYNRNERQWKGRTRE